MKHRPKRSKNTNEPPMQNYNNPSGMSNGPYDSGNPGAQGDITFRNGGYIYSGYKYADGGQTQQQGSPINIEGSGTQQGTSQEVHKGELLVKSGKVLKNYSGYTPHPSQGTNPESNVNETPGAVVIPKKRVDEYLNSDQRTRKMIERSLVSQQMDRSNKALDVLKNQGLMHPDANIQGNQIQTPQDQQQQSQGQPPMGWGGVIGGVLGAGIGTLIAPGVGTTLGYTLGSSIGGNVDKAESSSGTSNGQRPVTNPSNPYGQYQANPYQAHKNGGQVDYIPSYPQYSNGGLYANGGQEGNLYYNLIGQGYPQVFDHNYTLEADIQQAYKTSYDNVPVRRPGGKMQGKSDMIGTISANKMKWGGGIPQSAGTPGIPSINNPELSSPMAYDNKIVGAQNRVSKGYQRPPNLAHPFHPQSPRLRYGAGGFVNSPSFSDTRMVPGMTPNDSRKYSFSPTPSYNRNPQSTTGSFDPRTNQLNTSLGWKNGGQIPNLGIDGDMSPGYAERGVMRHGLNYKMNYGGYVGRYDDTAIVPITSPVTSTQNDYSTYGNDLYQNAIGWMNPQNTNSGLTENTPYIERNSFTPQYMQPKRINSIDTDNSGTNPNPGPATYDRTNPNPNFTSSQGDDQSTSGTGYPGQSLVDKYGKLGKIGDDIYNAAAKPSQFNANNYRVPNVTPNFIPTRTGQQEIQDAYNVGYQNLKNSGQFNRAGVVGLMNARAKQDFSRRLQIGTQNTGIANQFASENAGINQYNAGQRFQVDVNNMRNQAAQRNYQTGLFSDLSTMSQEDQNNDMYRKFYEKYYGKVPQ